MHSRRTHTISSQTISAWFARIQQGVATVPFSWILIPVFFVLKNEVTYFTAISFLQSMELLAVYLAGACILYGLLRLLTVTDYKAALCCFVLLTVYFFYGNFDQFLQAQKWLYPFNMYRWSLSALLLVLGGALYIIARLKVPPYRTIRFLNLLLIFFCCSEAFPLAFKALNPPPPLLTVASTPSGQDSSSASRALPHTSPPTGSAPSPHPNIYFLLFDEYQGNAGLLKVFHYPNDRLKNTLAAEGFFSPSMARSNYNFTFFSMPSIFNMDYLRGEIQGKEFTGDLLLFSSGIGLIRNSRLIGFLKNINYSVVNLSPFALDDTGAVVSQFRSVTTGKDLIRDQTFYSRFKEKFGWMIPNKTLLRFLGPSDYNNLFYNEYVLEHLVAESALTQSDSASARSASLRSDSGRLSAGPEPPPNPAASGPSPAHSDTSGPSPAHSAASGPSPVPPAGPESPRREPKFVYAHLFLPHLPFLKDSSGSELDFKVFMQKKGLPGSEYLDERYLDYLKYANTVMLNTVDTLIRNDPGAIIIIMSDHGYRGLAQADRQWQYNNQFYIRTPEREYAGWPDTVDAVNAFRLLLNKEFGQQLGYLPYRTKEFRLPGK